MDIIERLDAIDMSTIDAEIERLEKDLSATDAAVQRSQDRVAEIDRLTAAEKRNDHVAFAEAAVSGTAFPAHNEELREERDKHVTALRGLQFRRTEISGQIRTFNADRLKMLGDAFDPMIDALEERALEAAALFLGIEEAATRVGRLNGRAALLARRISDARLALKPSRLMPRRDEPSPQRKTQVLKEELAEIAQHPLVQRLALRFGHPVDTARLTVQASLGS